MFKSLFVRSFWSRQISNNEPSYAAVGEPGPTEDIELDAGKGYSNEPAVVLSTFEKIRSYVKPWMVLVTLLGIGAAVVFILDYVREEAEERPHYDSRYLTPNTEEFVVNGKLLPDINFDIGESYAGLIPVTTDEDESRKLFFWFFPSENPAASNEITIWLNGGPGCSSLVGLMQENGPFLWQMGTFSPVQNPYSWTNLTNMLYIDQAIGVGFSQGAPDILDEVGLAEQFLGFYKNFAHIFDVQSSKIYLTGESYAGTYLPYIGAAILAANDASSLNLGGVMLYDPVIGDPGLQIEVPAVAFFNYWENVYGLNESFTESVQERAEKCNYTSYLEDNLLFPPPGSFPPPTPPYVEGCGIYDDIFTAARLVNPCFNRYHVTEQCPYLWNVLGPYGSPHPTTAAYFNRPEVQKAINASPTEWWLCTGDETFPGPAGTNSKGDLSESPAQSGVLQTLIERTNNVVIANGDQDSLLSTNGTLLAIQNITWNGFQGFQTKPVNDFQVPYHREYSIDAQSGAGIAGKWGTERGLTFASVHLGGHNLPSFAPGATYRLLELLLGRVDNLSTIGSFSTQVNNAQDMER